MQLLELFPSRKIISPFLYTACTIPIALGTIIVISFIERNGGLHTFWRVGDIDMLAALLCISGIVFWIANIAMYKLEGITQPKIIDHFRQCIFFYIIFVFFIYFLLTIELTGAMGDAFIFILGSTAVYAIVVNFVYLLYKHI